MAISPKCATAIRAAAGSRPISAGKMQAISDGLDAKMRELARQDPQRWQGLSRDQRMSEAAAAAMADIAAEAKLKEFRAGLQALRAQETGERIAEQMGLGGKVTRSQAYIRDLVNTDDYAAGVRNEAISGLKDLLEAAGNRDGTGLLRNLGMRVFDLDNPQMTADVVREVFKNADGHTGNKAAKAAAKAWLDTIESMRLKFNGAGGDVGKLGYGYLSQAHDAFRVADAGADKWARFILDNNLLDRKQYVDVDGQLLGDAAVLDMLKAAHSTIAEHGANKTEPGSFKGSGSRANRGSDHRVLHFKDGDAWMAYMREYGEGSMYDAMMSHIGAMSRDIALTERMGPNPESTHRVQSDIARRADAVHGKAGELIDGRSAGNTPDAYWNIVSGKTGRPESKFLARAGSDLRNIQTAAKITWGPFSALADVGTILQTLHYDKIPYLAYLKAYGRQFDAKHRATLRAHEVIAESLTHSINRWTGDNVGHSMTGHVTNGVMRLSLMNAWTDAARNAFADVMMTNATKQLGKSWASLTEWDRYLMQRKGITEADWSIITQAKPDPASRVPLLSPPAIRATGLDGAEQAATKWGAYVTDESQFAVVNPDIATRAIVTGGGMPAGTFNGEAWRSIAQFKSFPIAMLTRHWRRVMETPQGMEGAPVGFGAGSGKGAAVNRVALLAALGVTTTLLGAIQTQSRQILSGRDPIDMERPEFWGKAFAAGGGAGFLADLLMAPTDSPIGGWGGKLGAFGPVAGAGGGVIDIFTRKEKGATAVRWVSDQLPFVDMWQTRALYERYLLHNAQEFLNPGYLSRMERRTQQQWGQEWWWSPGPGLPERAPDLGAAVGQ